VLRAAGYKVVAAANVDEAWSVLGSQVIINAVVTDVEMPGKGGFHLVEAMRKQPRLTKIPAIALASTITPEAIDRAHKLGISEFVAKFDRAGLISALSETQNVMGEAA
jgi:two-component system, chemotaxis family, sensor kinase CheA